MENNAPSTVQFELSHRQKLAWQALGDPEVAEVMYGGAKGGGKSVFMCIWVLCMCLWIIQEFKVKKRKKPIPVGWMGRLKGSHFKETTLETWFKMIPENLYTINKQAQEIVIGGAVKVFYGGLDDREAVNKFNSAEFCFICVDQAEEVPKNKVDVLLASRRLKINGRDLPTKALFTANPAQCWLRDDFILTSNPKKRFVQALPTDNPWLAASYIDILRDAFSHRPELLAAYLEGSWDAFEGDDQIILDKNITTALTIRFTPGRERKYIVCDPARFGDDETVMYLFHDTDIVGQKIYGKKDTMFTANMLHVWGVQEKVTAIGIDTIGIGAGVYDRLREMSDGAYKVISINSAEAAADSARYINARAEMWDKAAKMLADGDISLSADMFMSQNDWNKLKGQLLTPKYEFRNGKIKCESKEDIKKRLQCSPDRADCAVMGWYIYDSVPFVKKESDKPKYKRRQRRSAMSA